MKIADLLAGKEDRDKVDMEGISVPVSALDHLANQGYETILVYKDNQTFSLWGKNCSACFTREHIETLA